MHNCIRSSDTHTKKSSTTAILQSINPSHINLRMSSENLSTLLILTTMAFVLPVVKGTVTFFFSGNGTHYELFENSTNIPNLDDGITECLIGYNREPSNVTPSALELIKQVGTLSYWRGKDQPDHEALEQCIISMMKNFNSLSTSQIFLITGIALAYAAALALCIYQIIKCRQEYAAFLPVNGEAAAPAVVAGNVSRTPQIIEPENEESFVVSVDQKRGRSPGSPA